MALVEGIKKIGVIGCGLMGGGIAQVAAKWSWQVSTGAKLVTGFIPISSR
ncbi:MAG: hypothetical protein WCS37_00340 [Chloroflexota bacterium]|nr:hypothetical protein [Chloroflexota bacterium]